MTEISQFLLFKKTNTHIANDWIPYPSTLSLLPILGFVLNEKFQRNASKFAIFYIHTRYAKIQSYFFRISFRAILFFLNECPSLCRHNPGHSLGEKIKVAQHEKRKRQLWVFVYYIKYGFWSVFAGTFRRAQSLKLGGVYNNSGDWMVWIIFSTRCRKTRGNFLFLKQKKNMDTKIWMAYNFFTCFTLEKKSIKSIFLVKIWV